MTSLPPQLPRVVPHLGQDGQLCYLARGTVALDVFDVPGQVLACLAEAEKVLSSLLRGEKLEDLEEEFYAYWGGWHCLEDVQERKLGRHACLVLGKTSPMLVVTDDRDRTSRKLAALQTSAEESSWPAFRIRTKASPRPDRQQWPPKRLGQLLSWQSRLDPRCRKKIEQRVREAVSEKARGVLLLIESPKYTYGAAVDLEKAVATGQKRRLMNAELHEAEVTPVSVVRIDDRYMAERNTPGRTTLSGKRIVVVGCGTIGGYLADLLVKAGAGTGGGWMELVDFDSLWPSNVGRHRLGFEYVFKNKAVALQSELSRHAPGADIRAKPVNVSEAGLFEYDLLIDATGEESLGCWLSQRTQDAAMLSVWVEGPGIAARALLRHSAESACYRCLVDANRRGELLVLNQPTPVVLAGQGCEGLYVPFPATASVQAASLATELTLDWANGRQSPGLRTRLLHPDYELATHDCDLLPRVGCVVCGQ
ncbi:ThiF family adenylyltransferase [Hydrogenophaga sp.]|uniref:ThiF family adenylyltransferase n=1 Tax=Hydrogenophaga sp. TaxID=1904254 RepID=UPI00257A4D78|nr:ThiF family adenylyltransferase [Hydrogenophaga sp.]